jgi:glycerophosphoryl diester phosphodiesterase
MRRLAHRGDWRVAPENSLAALVAATRLPGIDGVEFDVRLAADGEPVVIHDPDLRRVQGIDGRVDELEAAILGAHGVPRLVEVLEALPPEVFVDIDLKVDPSERFIETCIIARGRTPDRAVIDVFDPQLLVRLRERAPGWPRWLGTDSLDRLAVEAAAAADCQAISAEWHSIDPAGARLVAAAGLELAAWTVTDQDIAEQLAGMGVTTIFVEGDALRPAGGG